MVLLKDGDRESGFCQACGQLGSVRYERRDYAPSPERPAVPDVLVGVCEACGEVASIPAQSAPRLRESIRPDRHKIEARISPDLIDVLGLIAAKFRARPDDFGPLAMRLYVQEAARNPKAIKRIKTASKTALAAGKNSDRLSINLAGPAWVKALAAAKEMGVESQGDFFRGVIVAAAVDSGLLEVVGVRPIPEMKRGLEALGLATSDALPIEPERPSRPAIRPRKPRAFPKAKESRKTV